MNSVQQPTEKRYLSLKTAIVVVIVVVVVAGWHHGVVLGGEGSPSVEVGFVFQLVKIFLAQMMFTDELSLQVVRRVRNGVSQESLCDEYDLLKWKFDGFAMFFLEQNRFKYLV